MAKADDPIKVLEMIPGNAAVLLEHAGQPVLAEKVRGVDSSLVQIVQIGEAVDWCEEPLAERLSPGTAFKLVEYFPLLIGEETLIRIVGILEPDKETLKKTLKAAPSYAKRSHLSLVQELDLFMPMEDLGEGLWSWLPKADAVKQRLVDWWREEHLKQNFELMTTPSCLHVSEDEDPGFYLRRTHTDYWEKRGAPSRFKTAEISYLSALVGRELKNGLFESIGWIADRAHVFLTDEELFQECISSLQFIIKIPKILGFEFQTVLYIGNGGTQKKDSKEARIYRLLQEVLKEARLEYFIVQDPMLERQTRIQLQVPDSLGRWWDGPFLEIDGSVEVKAGFTTLVRSAFHSLERLIALCVEKDCGRWPFWLAPEQVRIIPVNQHCDEYAQALRDRLQKAGIRTGIDRQADAVKTRLHRSLAEQVHFAVLIGQHEVDGSCVSYRAPHTSNNEKMGVEEFINKMRELNGSKDSELEN